MNNFMRAFGNIILIIGVATTASAEYIMLTSEKVVFFEVLLTMIVGIIITLFGGFMSGRSEGKSFFSFFVSLMATIVALAMTLGAISYLFASNAEFLWRFIQGLVSVMFGLGMMAINGFSMVRNLPTPMAK